MPTDVQTERLARSIGTVDGAALSDRALERAGRGLLDWMGVALAGAREPAAASLHDLVGGGSTTLVGTAIAADPLTAALANGVAAHALDFDDTHPAALTHVSAPVLAAVLAAAETRGDPGRAVVAAYLAGVETAVCIGDGVGPRLAHRGFHATGVVGAFGAAAGVARLLGLDSAAIMHALGIAGAQSAGLTASFGTMTKPLQAGKAALNGLLAAQLAARGFTGPADVLERDDGWLRAYLGEDTVLADRPFDLDGGALQETSVKPYPSCLGTHAAIDAALDLRDRVRLDDIADVEVLVDPVAATVASIPRPVSGLEGKFSLGYCVIRALRDGAVGTAHFADDRIAEVDPALLGRVRVVATDNRPVTWAVVRLTLRDGSVVEQEIPVSRGNPERPMTEAELSQKFRALAEPVLGAETADELRRRCLDLSDVADVAELMRLARTPAG